MSSKKRVLQAVNHEEGEIPIDFGGTSVTGIHCSVVEKLRVHFGLDKHPVLIIEPCQMLGLLEDDLCEAMGVDTRPIWNPYCMFGFKNENWKKFKTFWGQTVLVPGNFTTTIREGRLEIYAQGDTSYGPAAVMPQSGYFFDSLERQVDEIDDDALDPQDNLEEFGPIGQDVLDHFEKASGMLRQRDHFICGNTGGTSIGDIALIPGPMLKHPKGIRSVEEWYISTVTRKEYLHKVFTIQTEIAIENLRKVHDVAADLFDALFICGTDFGTQISTFCSPQTFEELYMPYYRKMNDWVHANTNWKSFKHSCGAVGRFFPLFTDAGFDIINPVQWTAKGMEKDVLKNRYGDKIVFWGGGVDTQKTLPFGTTKEVYDEVLEVCKVFGKGGGFVFSSIHNIQAGTPVENVVAMLDAIHDYNGDK